MNVNIFEDNFKKEKVLNIIGSIIVKKINDSFAYFENLEDFKIDNFSWPQGQRSGQISICGKNYNIEILFSNKEISKYIVTG